MASVLSLRCNRKRQTNVLTSQPAQLKQNKVNNTQQWRDKWWQYQASPPKKEHFTWKQPSDQNLIFAVVMLFGFCLQRRRLYVTNPGWHSPARSLTVYTPSCGSRGISLFFFISKQQGSLLHLNLSTVSSWWDSNQAREPHWHNSGF